MNDYSQFQGSDYVAPLPPRRSTTEDVVSGLLGTASRFTNSLDEQDRRDIGGQKGGMNKAKALFGKFNEFINAPDPEAVMAKQQAEMKRQRELLEMDEIKSRTEKNRASIVDGLKGSGSSKKKGTKRSGESEEGTGFWGNTPKADRESMEKIREELYALEDQARESPEVDLLDENAVPFDADASLLSMKNSDPYKGRVVEYNRFAEANGLPLWGELEGDANSSEEEQKPDPKSIIESHLGKTGKAPMGANPSAKVLSKEMSNFQGDGQNPLLHDRIISSGVADTEEASRVAELIESGSNEDLMKILEIDKNRGNTLLTDEGRAAIAARVKGEDVSMEVDPNNIGFGRGVLTSGSLGPQLSSAIQSNPIDMKLLMGEPKKIQSVQKKKPNLLQFEVLQPDKSRGY